jgi:hypothetical protein
VHIPKYVPEEQHSKYVKMKLEFVVPAEEHSVRMHVPSHIPISQSITYLQKRKEREE